MAEDATSLENSAHALVSMKEGKGNKYKTSSPVRRELPVRTRKPNRRIYGLDQDEAPQRLSTKSRKQSKHVSQPPRQPVTAVLAIPDKKVAQTIGVRLRNLLKLPKAHKWVCYEWFYSNIDMPLFLGENDFCICLKESFPQLKTRKLTRVQWCKVRRLMGKPRRCSPAFFAEERAALQKKREKIRMLQQRKAADVVDFKDLPDEIPMSLVIGTKVTARLRKPQDGLFTGVIDALDTTNNTYRITFHRPGLGTHSVLDTEVLSSEPQETIHVTAFQTRRQLSRPSLFSPPRFSTGMSSPGLVGDNDPLLGGSPFKGSNLLPADGTLGGFPIRFLVLVTRLTKILQVKKEKIKELKDMNTEAEKMKSHSDNYDIHFQQRYANIVIDLERLNKDLDEYLVGVQSFSQEIAPDQDALLAQQPSEIRRKCEKEAHDMVKRTNTAPGKKMVRNERMLELITKLTSLLLQVRTFADNDMHSFEFKSLQDSLQDIKLNLDPSNKHTFQNNVEIHVNHIQSGLTQMGNLHAFATQSSNSFGF